MNRQDFLREVLGEARAEHDETLSAATVEAVYKALCNVACAELLGGGSVELERVGFLEAFGDEPRDVFFVAGTELREAMEQNA